VPADETWTVLGYCFGQAGIVNLHSTFLASHWNTTRKASAESHSLGLIVEAMAEGHRIDFGVGTRVAVQCFCLEQTLLVVVLVELVAVDPCERNQWTESAVGAAEAPEAVEELVVVGPVLVVAVEASPMAVASRQPEVL
jgi:hypothetical protein